mgnify:CR=1 FL=1
MSKTEQSIDVGQEMVRVQDGNDTKHIRVERWTVTKVTPRGCWVVRSSCVGLLRPRFMRVDARRRFACLTEKEALESYLARKNRQVAILEQKLWRAHFCRDAVRSRLGLLPLSQPFELSSKLGTVVRDALRLK